MKTGRSKVVVNDKELALVAHKGTVYAIQEKCPHAGKQILNNMDFFCFEELV